MIRYLVSAKLSPEDIYPTLLGAYFKKEEAIARWESLLERYSEAYLSSEIWGEKKSPNLLKNKSYLN